MSDLVATAAAFPPHAIAIVGLAGRFPGAADLDAFWRNMRNGVETLDDFSDSDLDAAGVPAAVRADPRFVRRGTVLDRAEWFDAGFFGLSPREAQIMDPQQRIFLECAWEALEHAGYVPGTLRMPVGVYAGTSMNTYLMAQLLRDPALIESMGGYQLMLGNDKDFLCTRVSYKLDLRGPSMTVQTACSSSLVAVEAACRALQNGDCDMALAGGVSVSFPQRGGYLHQAGMILSPDARCRPFDAEAAGTRAGAGAGIVVLKRLGDALADRDTVHAVIRGAAINNDGADKMGFTAPGLDGQVEVVTMAQSRAGTDPRSISFIEAHGTATPLGDPVEVAALTRVFRARTDDVGFCRLGSLKANLGHLDAAAGVAGLIRTVLALQHREIPPLVNFRSANPQLDLARSPFAASSAGTPWPGPGPRRAGVSSFGIGGTNAHVVLEEAPAVVAGSPLREERLLVLSARNPAALDQAGHMLADWLDAHPAAVLADVEWTLQAGRKPFAHRRALVVRDRTEVARALRRSAQQPVLDATHQGGARAVAFLFSGQGSQHAGMGAGLYRTEPVYRAAIDRCADLLRQPLGLDLREVMFATGEDRLRQTSLAQPALFSSEYALAALWQSWGVTPQAGFGHSIGEYVAAHLAGVMSLEDTLGLVALRGRLMQALPAGQMAAVHLGAAELVRYLAPSAEIAAVNTPELCVIAGPAGPMEETLRQLGAAGIACQPLHTSHAFHSAMMDPVLAPFTAAFDGIAMAPPRLPYVSSLTGDWITPEQATSPAYYAAQLRRPVQFAAGLRTLAADPDLFLLEVGPGSVLAGLARSILGTGRTPHVAASLRHPREPGSEPAALLGAAARLWLAGVALDWRGVQAGTAPRRVPLPTYPFERSWHGVTAPPVAVAAAPAGKAATADGIVRLYAPSWLRDGSLADAAPELRGCWIVFGDAGRVTDALMARLEACGATPLRVEAGPAYAQHTDRQFTVSAGAAADIAAVLQACTARHGPVAGAIVLWGMEGGRVATPLQVYAALVALATGLGSWERPEPVPVLVATTGTQSVLDEPVRHPGAALVLGPVLVLPTEVPGLRMRAVDLDPAGDAAPIADTLVLEAATPCHEPVVAHRSGRRWLQRFAPIRLSRAEGGLRQGGRYLITGGLGGIGLELARWLAGQVSARLLLTSRRALPPRAEWDGLLAAAGDHAWSVPAIRAIRAIESAGGEVIAVAADAADLPAMRAALHEAKQRWGGIDGVVHGAGVPGSGAIALRQDAGDAQAVIAPKVDGLGVLVELMADTPLDFVALMGSINAVLGAAGACDYAAANTVLDAFAESRTPPAWRRVVTIAWGAWAEVGMAASRVVPPARQAEHAALLRTGIPTQDGLEAFARILASGHSRVVATTFDLPLLQDELRDAGGLLPLAAPEPDPVVSRPELSSVYLAPDTALHRELAAIWTELTGVARIGMHDDFFALGGHSLLATRLLARVSARLGVSLALRDVFEAPTIHLLAQRIETASSLPDPGQGTEDEREEILI